MTHFLLTSELQSKFEKFKSYREREVDPRSGPNVLYSQFVDYYETSVLNSEQTNMQVVVNQVDHYVRYCETIKRLAPHIDQGMLIGETGAASVVLEFLRECGYRCTVLRGDFRKEISSPDDACDVLLSLEVLEHIKDQESDVLKEIAVFNFSGMKRYLAEMSRVLKRDGILFLTTPNANSLRVLNHWNAFLPSLMAKVHVRELTKNELLELIAPHYELLELTDLFCYPPLERHERKRLYRAVEAMGGSKENRGDDFFLTMRNKKGSVRNSVSIL
jgi:SAM-dependent methyltransferase